MKGYKTTYVDIMVDGIFYRQMPYEYSPIFPIDADDVAKCVKDKFPSLATKKFNLYFSDQRVLN